MNLLEKMGSANNRNVEGWDFIVNDGAGTVTITIDLSEIGNLERVVREGLYSRLIGSEEFKVGSFITDNCKEYTYHVIMGVDKNDGEILFFNSIDPPKNLLGVWHNNIDKAQRFPIRLSMTYMWNLMGGKQENVRGIKCVSLKVAREKCGQEGTI